MPNLPHNPTQQELKDRYWYEFLQYMKTQAADPYSNCNEVLIFAQKAGYENAFWAWIIDFKIGAADDTKL